MGIAAAVIQQPGKVEVHQMPDVPPPYLRFMRPTRPMYADPSLYGELSPTTTIDIETIRLGRHRLYGLSVGVAYWPDSWQDDWAVEELLRWEGRDSEIKRDKYYGDFIIDENQSARENERRQIESQPISSGKQPVVLVVHESVRERDMDTGRNVSRGIESKAVLRLERGVSGRYAADLSGKDGD